MGAEAKLGIKLLQEVAGQRQVQRLTRERDEARGICRTGQHGVDGAEGGVKEALGELNAIQDEGVLFP